MAALCKRTLGKIILNPKDGLKGNRVVDSELRDSSFDYLKKYYNSYQIQAVKNSLSTIGFHLIQGIFFVVVAK